MRRLLLMIGATKPELRFVVIISISCCCMCMASFIFFFSNTTNSSSSNTPTFSCYLLHTNYYSSITTFINFFFYLDRKLMFLICNAILAFLAKTIPLVSTPVSDDDHSYYSMEAVVQTPAKHHLHTSHINDHLKHQPPTFLVPPTLLEDKSPIMDHSQLQVADEDDEYLQVEEEEARKSSFPNLETTDDHSNNMGDDESDHVGDEVDHLGIIKEQEVIIREDEAEENMMSTEELNRKIEEFIRKMKEEIRVQDQPHFISTV